MQTGGGSITTNTPMNLCEIFDDCKVFGDCVATPETCSGLRYRLGDGYCNNYAPYNTEGCCWDGGDCIKVFDDCVATPETCSGDINSLGDDYCNYEFNTEECCWDWGDCIKAALVGPDPVDIGGIVVIAASAIVVVGFAFWLTLHNRNNNTSTARPPAESSSAPSITAEESREFILMSIIHKVSLMKADYFFLYIFVAWFSYNI